MIKAVIFDFFGVLVTEGFKQFRETYFSDDPARRQQAIDLINQVDAGLISHPDFSQQLAELAGISTDEVSRQLGNNLPNRPLLKFIQEEIKPKYKLGILSNSSENYPAKFLDKKDVELFDVVILSYRLGIVKPQLEIYQIAADKLGVSPAECIFIDDSQAHCIGAEKAGMKAVFYDDFLKAKEEIARLLKSFAVADN